MFDAAAMSGMITSLKATADLSQLAINAHDAAAVRSKVIELQGQIVAAQSYALAAQMNQTAILERVHLLEKEVTDLKTWDAEKQKYELVNIRDEPTTKHFGPAFARALKTEIAVAEPFHLICPDCYERSEKSILQEEVRPRRIQVLFCQRCRFEISRTGPWEPDTSRWTTPKKRK
jgi:hypothetical protein